MLIRSFGRYSLTVNDIHVKNSRQKDINFYQKGFFFNHITHVFDSGLPPNSSINVTQRNVIMKINSIRKGM